MTKTISKCTFKLYWFVINKDRQTAKSITLKIKSHNQNELRKKPALPSFKFDAKCVFWGSVWARKRDLNWGRAETGYLEFAWWGNGKVSLTRVPTDLPIYGHLQNHVLGFRAHIKLMQLRFPNGMVFVESFSIRFRYQQWDCIDNHDFDLISI